jgi:enterochelin esterase-like enzyme
MEVNIYLPKGYSEQNKYPVLYMFHGYSSSEDTWMPGLQLDVKASELIEAGKINPLIIVCPDMENSYGINSSPTYSVIGGSNRNNNLSQGMFEDYFIKELIPFIDANYSTDARRESRYTGGLSMGGFISIYLAFSHPDLFSKVGGHSPALFGAGQFL